MASVQSIDADELARNKLAEIDNLFNEDPTKINVDRWLSILKQIITAAGLMRDKNASDIRNKVDTDESIYADYSDDNEQFKPIDLTEHFASNSVKWTIRVKAFEVVHRLLRMNGISKAAFLRHLSDLVSLSFVAATSPYDDLKLQGFEMFKFLINRFASVEEKELPGHCILEQYKTQVLSALKPAFELDAPPYITAVASQVCSMWLCKGLERDSAGISRTYQMLLSTIDKLESQSVNQNSKLYTESELEQERLGILGSWAQLYISAKETKHESHTGTSGNVQGDSESVDALSHLVIPQIDLLIEKWWEALRDYALLIMPSHTPISLSHDNQQVYTRQVALRLFESVWPKLLLGCSMWLTSGSDRRLHPDGHADIKTMDDESCDKETTSTRSSETYCNPTTDKSKYLKFICGIYLRELCKCHQESEMIQESLPETTLFVLKSISVIINCKNIQQEFGSNVPVVVARDLYTATNNILIDCSKVRKQHKQALRIVLDGLQRIIMTKFKDRVGVMRYSVAKVVSDMSCIVRDMTLESSEDLNARAGSILSIKLGQLIQLLTLVPDIYAKDIELESYLSSVLESILKLDTKIDTMLIGLFVELVDKLRIASYQQNKTSPLQTNLVDVQVIIICNMIINDLNTLGKSDESLNRLDIHLKSFRLNLKHSSGELRQYSIFKLVNSILSTMPEVQVDADMVNFTVKQQIQQLEFGLKLITDTANSYPAEYDTCMDTETKSTLDKYIRLQTDIKNSTSNKECKETPKQTLDSKRSSSTRPAKAKIVLKADFSNFYGKK